MAEKVKDIREWLSKLCADTLVGIDDGGLALKVVDSDTYFEIGGMPEDVLYDTTEVMKSIVDGLRGKEGKEIARIHNELCDERKVEYLEDSLWRCTEVED